MDDPKIEDHSDEMEQDLHQLEDHIGDAEQGLQKSREAAGSVDDIAGDPSGEQNASGGEDPEGARNDVRGEDASEGSGNDVGGEDDEDEREPAEVANPT